MAVLVGKDSKLGILLPKNNNDYNRSLGSAIGLDKLLIPNCECRRTLEPWELESKLRSVNRNGRFLPQFHFVGFVCIAKEMDIVSILKFYIYAIYVAS